MKYAKIKNNIVIQIQPNKEEGFVEVENYVSCGMLQTENGFIIPEIVLTLDELKAQKLQELEKAKDEAQSQSVLVRDLYFFGGRDNGQKYKEAFDLAKMLGKTTGTVVHTAGMVEVDEAYMTEILVAIGTASYQAWYKLQQLTIIVNSAASKEEIEAVVW